MFFEQDTCQFNSTKCAVLVNAKPQDNKFEIHFSPQHSVKKTYIALSEWQYTVLDEGEVEHSRTGHRSLSFGFSLAHTYLEDICKQTKQVDDPSKY